MQVVYFYPLDIRMRLIGQKASMVLFGRTSSGQPISVIDGSYRPYFFIVLKDNGTSNFLTTFGVKVRDERYAITQLEPVTMHVTEKETQLLKAYVNNPLGISYLVAELAKHPEVKAVYEHDMPFTQSYLLDKRIIPGVLTQVHGEITNVHARVAVMTAQSIMQEEDEMLPKPKILAFDIETYAPEGKAPSPNHDPIIMISFYGNDFKKTITWKRFTTDNPSIEFVTGEFELLHAFKRTIEEFQPDFLMGYASDIFAFPYLKKRADKYNIALDIGADHSVASISPDETSIRGVTHIDLYKFITRVMSSRLETFRLDDIAKELIGEGKKQIDVDALAEIWDTNPSALEPYCEYNLHDAYLIYRLAEVMMPTLYELARLTNLQFFDVSRASFPQYAEAYLMKESRLAREIIPSRATMKQRGERNAFSHSNITIEPQPGIYHKVAVYDFTSLYPSIIVTHNISPGTLRCTCCNEIVPGEEMHFCKNKSGFFPRIIGLLTDRRSRIMKMMHDAVEKSEEQKKVLSARYESLRILGNAVYTYFAYPSSRWYSLECAKAISAYGRYYVQKVIDKVKEEDFEILYVDTDALFIGLGRKSPDTVQKLFDQINASFPERMRLEYEGLYPKAIFVATKEGKGAKRKYALLSNEGFLKITGLEASKRNTSIIAKEVQENVLYYILKDGKAGKAVSYLRTVINEVNERKIPLRKMVIFTQLQKDLGNYETIAPHVAVAKRMQQQGFNVIPGSLIEYVVATGAGTIAERSFVPSEVREYDADYYVNNQIIPAVEKIFEAAGVDLAQALSEKEQSSLGEFI